MKKLDLIAAVSASLDCNMKDARNTVDCVLRAIMEVTAKKKKCDIRGFGQFSARRQLPRVAYDRAQVNKKIHCAFNKK